MKKLLLPLGLVALASCNNVADKTCACIRTAANNGIIEGKKLDEHDLVNLCTESKEKLRSLPLDEKNAIVNCMDSALDRIANKDPFPSDSNTVLSPIKSTAEVSDYITKLKSRETYEGAIKNKAQYYFFKRPISGTLVVENIKSNPYIKEPIIEDKKIEVYGFLNIPGEGLDKRFQVRLKLSAEEASNIRKAYMPLSSTEYLYNQAITFNGICSDFGITRGGIPSLIVAVNDYKLSDLTEPAPSSTPVTDSIDTVTEAYSDSAYNNTY